MSAQRVKEVLAAGPHAEAAPVTEDIGVECEGSKFHNPRPLSAAPIDLAFLLELEGLEALRAQDVVYLCGTCRDNLSIYLAVRLSYDGQTPQAVRRDFGNIIRELGDRAWDHYAGPLSGRGQRA